MTDSTPALAIRARDLLFAWPGKAPVIDIEQFSVARGERVFLRGPSGSGKSTLLGLLGGVLTPARGEVSLLGTEISALSASARDRFRGEHLGFIFQMFNLIPYLSVLENVLLPADFSPARAARVGDDLQAEGRRLLAALGLGANDLFGRPVTELSIGQQQRVAAARALLGKPEIIVADEPTSSLDHDAREDFLQLLMSECRTQGSTLLFVSHDTSLGHLFDRVVSLGDLNRAGRARAHPGQAA
ncbi:MAG: ATP-binding cassette domain-containing protein [Gammaproteobacteria bacterium]